MGTQCLPYFLLARVLRLILSLELLHLRLCLPAGMPWRLGAWARGGETVFFFFIPGSGDFQHSNCNCGEKSVRACSARPTPPFVVGKAKATGFCLSYICAQWRKLIKKLVPQHSTSRISHGMKIKNGKDEWPLAACSGNHQTTVSSSPK